MRINSITGRLISSIFITTLLIYFMIKTTSPKIIFVPFLICSLSISGKSLGLIFNKEKIITLFDKLFKGGFFLFWFGFLIVACYMSIKDKNYSLIVFSLPFWLVGIYFVKKKLLNFGAKNNSESKFNFMKIISAGLVLITLLAGLIILVLGIIQTNVTMIFAGAFFAFGAFTFILFALMALGYFDKLKIDVFGLYVGILFVVIGIGIPAIKYGETFSIVETIQTFGFWILIPVMLVTAGTLQIAKCLKNRK